MKKLLLVLLFVPLVSFGQTKEELQLCLAAQSSSFTSDSEADNALDRILNVIGASKNFVLTPCSEINNAMATSYKGIRYILYDKAFMKLINSKTNDWASLFILAHEVGHHINGHTLDLTMYAGGVVEAKTLEAIRKQEIEADEFAAFILAKLGAPLNLVEDSIALVSTDKDDTYSSHPTKSKRLTAVRTGYNKAENTSRVNNIYVEDGKYYFEYENRGIAYAGARNYVAAIANYNKAIELKSDMHQLYFYRGQAKGNLKDTYGAIADYTKSIELIPNCYDWDCASVHSNRGVEKKILKDYYGAIADFTKAIELNFYKEDLKDEYFNRGNTKIKLKDYYGAIADYTKSIELVSEYADYYHQTEINNSYALYYTQTGFSKVKLGDTNGGCADFKKAISFGSKYNYWLCKRKL